MNIHVKDLLLCVFIYVILSLMHLYLCLHLSIYFLLEKDQYFFLFFFHAFFFFFFISSFLLFVFFLSLIFFLKLYYFSFCFFVLNSIYFCFMHMHLSYATCLSNPVVLSSCYLKGICFVMFMHSDNLNYV